MYGCVFVSPPAGFVRFACWLVARLWVLPVVGLLHARGALSKCAVAFLFPLLSGLFASPVACCSPLGVVYRRLVARGSGVV